MATTIRRLVDGAVLPSLPQTRIQVNPDAFSSSRSQTLSLGQIGEAIRISSILDMKEFGISWVSVDPTGQEQNIIRKFFSSNEYYVIDAGDLGIANLWATVNEIDADWKTIHVQFTARFGDFVNQASTVLSNQSIASGASAAYSGSYTNGSDVDAKLQLTLEANSVAVWNAGTEVNLTGLPFVIAAQDDYGRWNLTQRRKSIMLDSSRLILGAGYFKPFATSFFRIRPGETRAITLPAIANPFATAIPWSLKLEAVATKQEA